MEFRRAKTAGFCFGVDHAVKMAFRALEETRGAERRVFSYGPLIHNEAVIQRLEKQGLTVVESLEEIADYCGGKTELADVIIRAHGVGPEVYAKLDAMGASIIDATCPFVGKIHKLAEEQTKQGRQVVIVGSPDHPEVIGINGWCGKSAIIDDNIDRLKEFFTREKASGNNILYSVVAQTTFSKEKFTEFTKFLKKSFDKVIIFDTICSATSMRQQETVKIASEVDLMVIVGGRNSSNTRKLYDISKEICPAVLWAETADDIERNALDNIFIVGVTAGASTPDWIIEEVIGKMSEIDTNVAETTEVESFESMLEDSLKTLTSGQIVKGAISKIDDKGVYVDLGFKFEGFIAIDEFATVPGQPVADLKVGDEVEAMVVKVSDKDCEAILSKRRIDNKKNMQLLEASYENKTPVTVKVTEAVNGGVVAFVGSVRIFIPASQLAERFVKDISQFVGQSMDVIITSFEKGPKGHNRIIGSRKVILVAEREKLDATFWTDIYPGKVCTGTVKSLTPFGAFVDLGGYDGLIHLSELSWKKIHHPQEVLSVGEEVEVTVLECDQAKKRISLGYRKAEDNPWFDAENLYQVGDILEVTVVRFVSFGVFVNIATGVDGLVHISQISNQRISSAADCLKIGQKVMAKIIDTNIAEKKINLSIRDVQAYDPEPKPVELDENGEPIVPEKKERKKGKGVKGEKKTKKDEDEVVINNEPASMGTSIGDILASKLQAVPEVSEETAE
ncbi:MAG: bifunctional 4-hydroxy-3-methylbut-2-enyl diphosphate reductase/30S ribosomal protein S1 [Clostridia bacterium]|nr:bifunctional 4-hydroxy-3-methylbut-2-enyl diphosphate reductase/30S ribosomal protein S1 [Clostridia bacterium]